MFCSRVFLARVCFFLLRVSCDPLTVTVYYSKVFDLFYGV